MSEGGEMVVAQQEAVYFYSPEDRGGCFGLEGEKEKIVALRHYLLLVSLDARGRHILTIYDTRKGMCVVCSIRKGACLLVVHCRGGLQEE
jgi:hypothetical protein